MHVLVALALLLQESPETAFHRIEGAIEKARSVKVLYTLQPAKEPESLSRGTMTLDGDLSLKMSADLRNKDGTRMPLVTEYEKGKIKSAMGTHQVELPGEGRLVRQSFNMYLTRVGIVAGAMFEHGFWSSAKGGAVSVDLKQMFAPTRFIAVGDGKDGSKIMSYTFESALRPIPFVWAKIWYDPNTYRLLRREVGWMVKGKEEVLIEEYEIHLDEEAPAPAPAKPAPPAPPAGPRTEAETDILFIRARLEVANEHLRNGGRQKAIDVLEDLALSFPKHPLLPEIQRLLDEARNRK